MSRPVLSAEDVRAARRRGELRVEVPTGALVTPLARDEAERWGIELAPVAAAPQRVASVAGTGAGAAPHRHVATCDPDDLERVIERVRALVPRADPAQVREIARRVLERVDG